MGMGMCWLAGGKISHDEHVFHFSCPEACECCHDFLDGVLSAKELAIQFPSNHDEWDMVRKGFKQRSRCDMFHGCVGAIDGFFQKTMLRMAKKLQMRFPVILDVMNLMVQIAKPHVMQD